MISPSSAKLFIKKDKAEFVQIQLFSNRLNSFRMEFFHKRLRSIIYDNIAVSFPAYLTFFLVTSFLISHRSLLIFTTLLEAVMQTINGTIFYEMLRAGAAAMEEDRERINDLNVFPVPDGDTGSNMTTTVQAVRQIEAVEEIGVVAAQAARQMMRSARGNSGVILSLFFRGMARSLAGHETVDCDAIVAALREGAVQAASAVDKPVEGTILTVMRDCVPTEPYADDAAALFTETLHRAEEILAQTPEMLPALKRAKVVDSGGAGFVSILAGMTSVLTGTARVQHEAPAPAAVHAAHEDKDPASADADDTDDAEIRFGFCTECLLDLDGAIPEEHLTALRQTLQSMGDSMVLTADDELFKVHIHTNEPMQVLAMLLPLGTLRASKIENMRLQHDGVVKANAKKEKAQKTRENSTTDEAGAREAKDADFLTGVKNTLREVTEPIEDAVTKLIRTVLPAEDEPEDAYAVIAAADGEGFADLFREMGAADVVPLNPSPEDFLRAIEAHPAKNTILLPNNKNALLAAKQAAEMAHENGRAVDILPTRFMPQGISALFAFHESRTAAENLENMRAAVREVTTLGFTTAARDAEADGVSVRAHDIIGLQNGVIRISAPTLSEAVASLLSTIADCATVSVYYGKDMKKSAAAEIFAEIEKALPDADVTEVDGGQGVYTLLVSGE